MTETVCRWRQRRGVRLRAALAACGLLAVGCDPTAILNPSISEILGLAAVQNVNAPAGFVLIVFQNDTDTAARLVVDVQTPSGIQRLDIGPNVDDPIFSGIEPGAVEMRAIECTVSQVVALSASMLVPVDVAELQLQNLTNANTGITTQQLVLAQVAPAGFVQIPVQGIPTVDLPLCGSVIVFNLRGTLEIPEREFCLAGICNPAFILGAEPPFPQPNEFKLRVSIR